MSRLDDRLTRELEQAARPASPAGVFESVGRRRARRARLRKIQSGALIVVVLTGTLAGVAVLRSAFREPADGIGDTPSVGNGLIVYSEMRNAGQRLWTVRPDGTGARPLTDGDGGSDTGPTVSPDGSLVAFTRTGERGSAIYLVGIDGTGLRRATEQSWGARDPGWSPDGSEFVFAGDAGDGEGLYVMAPLLEGAAPHRITDSSLSGLPAESGPSWSPDGSTIVFTAGSKLPGVAEPINFDLFEAPADGSGPVTNLTDTPDVAEVAPAWSPDGERIAFVRVPNTLDDTPAGGIATIRPDGSDLRVLTNQHAFEQGPTWAPDGSVIAFQRDDPEGTSIYTIRPDGTELTRVTVGSDPAWQPIISSSRTTDPATPSPGEGQDLGLAFPVCHIRPLVGDFDGNGSRDTAYVATKKSDVGDCPQADSATAILGVDLTADGGIDAEFGRISCELDCQPFLAIDLDQDGDDELIVQQSGGSVLRLVPYDVVGADDVEADGPGIGELVYAFPGDRSHGFLAGAPASFFLGGDEGFSATLDCQDTDTGRLLIYAKGELDSIEQPTTWSILRTTFRLGPQGLEVVEPESFDRPFGNAPPAELARGDGLCGHPFPPNPALET